MARVDPMSVGIGAMTTLMLMLFVTHRQLLGDAAHARSLAKREDKVVKMMAEHDVIHQKAADMGAEDRAARRGAGNAMPEGETEESLKARPHPEHIVQMRDAEYHRQNKDRWEEQAYSRPYLLGLRTLPCAVQEATDANNEAVALVREIIDDDVLALTADFSEAVAKFGDALRADRGCVSARLNYLITMTAAACHPDKGGDLPGREKELVAVRKDLLALRDYVQDKNHAEVKKELKAEVFLWLGIVEEMAVLTDTAITDSRHAYQQAFQIDPDLSKEHIHPTRPRDLMILRPQSRKQDAHYRPGLVCLLFYYEFGPAMGGYPKLSYAQTQQFLRDWHVKVDKALPPYVFAVVVRTYRNVMDKRILIGAISGYKGASSQESNSDCVNTWYNIRVTEFVRRLAGIDVVATYGYTAGYETGDVLKPHTDRKACEFTLTTLIEAYPHVGYCPLYAQKTPWEIDRQWIGRYEDNTIKKDDIVNLAPQLNQWLVLRGRAKPHFRPALAEGATCTTFLSHFIPVGEPSA